LEQGHRDVCGVRSGTPPSTPQFVESARKPIPPANWRCPPAGFRCPN
jgi:hypothetical protein